MAAWILITPTPGVKAFLPKDILLRVAKIMAPKADLLPPGEESFLPT
jgi:hypothetical protein